MLKSIPRYLIISLLLLGASSCKTLKLPSELSEFPSKTVVNPYFNDSSLEYLYSAQIKVFNNSLSGILVVKKIGDKHQRLALLSDFGNTLLDIEYKDNKMRVNYVMDDLNKKIILNKLMSYFQLLIHEEYESTRKFDSSSESVYEAHLANKLIGLTYDSEQIFKQLTYYKGKKEKVLIYYKGNGEIADEINFISKELPIELKLTVR